SWAADGRPTPPSEQLPAPGAGNALAQGFARPAVKPAEARSDLQTETYRDKPDIHAAGENQETVHPDGVARLQHQKTQPVQSPVPPRPGSYGARPVRPPNENARLRLCSEAYSTGST